MAGWLAWYLYFLHLFSKCQLHCRSVQTQAYTGALSCFAAILEAWFFFPTVLPLQ